VSFFEGLEVQSQQQRAEGLFVEGVGLLQTALDDIGERAEVWGNAWRTGIVSRRTSTSAQ